MSLKEAKKLIDNSKGKLNLVINREQNGYKQNTINNNNRHNDNNNNGYTNGQSRWSTANLYDNAIAIKEHGFDNMNNTNRNNWSNQNVYVQPPTRGTKFDIIFKFDSFLFEIEVISDTIPTKRIIY